MTSMISPEVVLVERADVDVVLELLDRVAVEGVRHLLVGVAEVVDERSDPFPARLDGGDPEVGEAGEHAVADEGGHGVLNRPMAAGHVLEGVEPEGQHFARAGPVARVPGVAAVGGVHRHEDVGVHHGLPERVELGIAERPRATEARDRGGTDEHGLGSPLHRPLELLDRLLDDRERDDRRGEDPVLVVELPLLVHPLVQRVDRRVRQLGVVAHALFEEAGQRGEHERAGRRRARSSPRAGAPGCWKAGMLRMGSPITSR